MDDEAYYLSQIPPPKASRVRPKQISSLVNRVLTKYGVASQRAAEQLQSQWASIVGPTLAECTRLGNVQRQNLLVVVENNLVAQELHMRKREILAQLKKDPSLANLKDLRFQIGSIR